MLLYQCFVSSLLLLTDITLCTGFGMPILSTILCYYMCMLCQQVTLPLLVIPGFFCALESLLLLDSYAPYSLIILTITYAMLILYHCLNKTLTLATILTALAILAVGGVTGIAWHLSPTATVLYTSTLFGANIIGTVGIWYIFDKGKQGNR